MGLSYDKNEVINTQFLKDYLKQQNLKERIFIISTEQTLLESLMVKEMALAI